jgi:hypothetical protein
MASGAPPVSTDVGLYQPVVAAGPAGSTGSTGSRRSGLGWKLALGIAAVLAVLTGAVLAILTSDDTTPDAQETAAAASPDDPTGQTPAPAGETLAETPESTVEIAPAATDPVSVETPRPRPRLVPATEPAPEEESEAETEAPEETAAVYQPAEPEPSPEPPVSDAPFEELKRLGTEIQASGAGLLATYQAFLEQKENAGGEITDDDEELEDLIDSFAGSAEKFNKYIQGGGFLARLRRRGDTEVRPLLSKRMKDLADRADQVDALMGRVQPGAEVRQAWQQLRQRGQRAGRLVAALQ